MIEIMNKVNWTPTSRDELMEIVRSDFATLSPKHAEKYLYEIQNPASIKVKRSDEYGIEEVFLLAKLGESCVIYDDVEEQFAVARCSLDPLEDWCNYASLEAALLALEIQNSIN